MEEELLTVPEVATLLKLNEQTVRRWLRSGRLVGVSLGSRQAGWRVRRSEVDKLLLGDHRGEGAAA
jgi:excisionase family DNA binding protein